MFTTDHDVNRRISEACVKVLLENASDKKIKKIADEYFGKMGVLGKRVVNPQTGEEMSYPKTESKPERPMFYDSAFLTNQCSELVPHCTLASRKFMPAVARIILPKLMRGDTSFTRDADELNKILKIIVNDRNHLNEYDNDLNGMSIEELKKRFGDTVKKNLEVDKKLVASTKRTANKRYKIIRCPEQKDLLPFGEPLTTWCVAQKNGIGNYNGYTNNGISIFYVCLRDDYKTVKPVAGANVPFDDYGLSMIAINVNDDGSLKNCTCRWNHANGGNDNVMDEKQLSDLLGVNFYETFKPRGIDEVWEKVCKNGHETDISRVLGGIEMEPDNCDHIRYAIRDDENNVVRILTQCHSVGNLICLAEKNLSWFDIVKMKFVEGPDMVVGDFSVSRCTSLISLKGAPSGVGENFDCSGCTSLTSLEGAPSSVGGGFDCYGCTSLISLKGAPSSVGLSFDCKDCNSLTTLEGAPNSVGVSFYSSECTSLTSLEGAPSSVYGNFDCSGCSSLISLKGAPRSVGWSFACGVCTSLTSLEGAPNSVGKNFDCFGCTSLTSLECTPGSVGGSFDCRECTSLTSLEGAPSHIGGLFFHD